MSVDPAAAGGKKRLRGFRGKWMKISFIIPARDAAGCIVRSVDSVVSLFRGVVPFEVIIVENGSADDTPRAASGLAARHPEVLLLRSETGVSKARNAGMRRADGDWLCFVDADDVCEPGMVKALPLLEKYAPDILVSGYRKGKRAVYDRYKIRGRLISGEELEPVKARMISAPTRRMTVWAKFYRRDFLISGSLFFDESLTRSEDSEFLIRALNRCEKILFSDLIVYGYCQAAVSAMRSVSRGSAAAYLEALRKAEPEAAGGGPGVRAAFPDFVYSMIAVAAVHDFFDSAVRTPWQVRRRGMAAFLREGPVKRALDRMTFKSLLRPRNWPAFLFKCRLVSLGGAVCYLRSVRNRRRVEEAGPES